MSHLEACDARARSSIHESLRAARRVSRTQLRALGVSPGTSLAATIGALDRSPSRRGARRWPASPLDGRTAARSRPCSTCRGRSALSHRAAARPLGLSRLPISGRSEVSPTRRGRTCRQPRSAGAHHHACSPTRSSSIVDGIPITVAGADAVRPRRRRSIRSDSSGSSTRAWRDATRRPVGCCIARSPSWPSTGRPGIQHHARADRGARRRLPAARQQPRGPVPGAHGRDRHPDRSTVRSNVGDDATGPDGSTSSIARSR